MAVIWMEGDMIFHLENRHFESKYVIYSFIVNKRIALNILIRIL